MAAKRRGARGPVGPGGTLGTLLRTTLAQAGVVRDVLERGAREGRARLDDARRNRRRDDALARLGEAVLDAVRAGDAQDLFDLPDVADALADLEGLDAGAEDPPGRGGLGDHDDRDDRDDRDAPARGRRARDDGGASWVPSSLRERFDRRPERPPPIVPRPGAGDDGTVSSGARPRRGDAEPGARFQERAPAARPAAAERAPLARDASDHRPARPATSPASPAARKGGIQFAAADDEDEDLKQYMHPDDVPPKPGADGDDG